MKALPGNLRRWLLWHSRLPGRLPFEAAILMYHRFTEAPHESAAARSHFAEHLDYLTRHYEVVSLDQALALPPGPRPYVALTIDDGYRSFYDVAYPELAARGLTATVFLPVDFIDSGGWMWQDRSIHVLRQAAPGVYQVPWRGETLSLDLGQHPALVRSLIQVYNIGRHLDHDGRREFSATLARHLGCDLPDTPPPFYAPLDWAQVRELHAGGFTFGAHTLSHAILTTLDPDEAWREIARSREQLADRLGSEVSCFAYPNGDLDREVRAMVERAGYTHALATTAGFWSAHGDPLAVPRLPAPTQGGRWLADRLWSWWHTHGAPGPMYT